MCRVYSMILTRGNDYFVESNLHEDIIREHNLREEFDGKVQIVRAEFVPPNDDYSADVSQWETVVDQDILPDWADDEAKLHGRIRRIGERIVREHTLTNGELTVEAGLWIARAGSNVTVNGGGVCYAYDRSNITVNNGGRCAANAGSNVMVNNGGWCTANAGSTIMVNNRGWCYANADSNVMVNGGGVCTANAGSNVVYRRMPTMGKKIDKLKKKFNELMLEYENNRDMSVCHNSDSNEWNNGYSKGHVDGWSDCCDAIRNAIRNIFDE